MKQNVVWADFFRLKAQQHMQEILLLWIEGLCFPQLHGQTGGDWVMRAVPSLKGSCPHSTGSQLTGTEKSAEEGLQPEPQHADVHLKLSVSRTWRNKYLLFTSYPFCSILLEQPEQTKRLIQNEQHQQSRVTEGQKYMDFSAKSRVVFPTKEQKHQC